MAERECTLQVINSICCNSTSNSFLSVTINCNTDDCTNVQLAWILHQIAFCGVIKRDAKRLYNDDQYDAISSEMM